MRRALVAWLAGHGLPTWFAPDYMTMVALAGVLSVVAALRLTRRDGADIAVDGRALAVGYVAALIGGYAFEALRGVAHAVAEARWGPILRAGRAAYGGLIGGVLGALWVQRRARAPMAPFLDRLVPLLGITYAFVRAGCFLAGCDYGRTTASAVGVRFPPGSPAAMEHAAHGWVPSGAPSLPVHATQLYEAALGVFASLAGGIWLARGYRDGRAFATWLSLYASGRIVVETFRGDVSRGIYVGLSTAQIVSLLLLAGVALFAARARRTAMALAACTSVLLCEAAASAEGEAPAPDASAQPPAAPAASAAPPAGGEAPAPGGAPYPPPGGSPRPPPGGAPYPYPPPGGSPRPPPGGAPYPYPPQGGYPYPPPGGAPYPYPPPGGYPYPPPGSYPYPSPGGYPYPPQGSYPAPAAGAGRPPGRPPAAAEDEATPRSDDQAAANKRLLGVRLGMSGYFVPGRFEIQDGGSVELDVAVRLAVGARQRFELGLELRGVSTADVTQFAIGAPIRLIAGLGRRCEMELGVTPGYTTIVFDSPYFEPVGAFGARIEWGLQFPIGSHFAFGLTPLGLLLLGSSDVRLVIAYEPRFWLGLGFL